MIVVNPKHNTIFVGADIIRPQIAKTVTAGG
jgi:hypothetical protein